jgi:transposase
MVDKHRGDGAPPNLRIQRPERVQIQLRTASLDKLVADDHPVRAVWAYAESVNLDPIYAAFRTFEGAPGRPPIDPKILFALWIYATLDGVGSGRRLARLCEEHQVYQWICGGVTVNQHSVSEFRVEHGDVLERMLIEGIAGLMDQKLVTMNAVAQDGMRVRASAGSSSFKRQEKLKDFLDAAERQVNALRSELNADPAASARRQDAARERVAKDREERVKKALAEIEKVKESKKKNREKREARASTTDPEARVMKMADGGFRPALNVQFVTDVESRLVVGVATTNSGSDKGQLVPMIKKLQDDYGQTPRDVLVDGDFITKDNVITVSAPPYEATIYAPVMKPSGDRNPYVPLPDDPPAVGDWRQRMGTEAAKLRYRDRASTAEWTNALARNRGLTKLVVRGLKKARAVALWFALAHNLMQLRLSRA